MSVNCKYKKSLGPIEKETKDQTIAMFQEKLIQLLRVKRRVFARLIYKANSVKGDYHGGLTYFTF